MFQPRSLFTSAASFIALTGIVACSGSDAAAPSEQPEGDPAAVADGYKALSAGRAEELPDVIRNLDDALEERPNGRGNLYAATMRFWRIAENGPGIGPFDTEATAVLDHFEAAKELLPDDARIPAFSGLAHTFLGGLLNKAERVDRGTELLEEGVERMPTYGHFLRALSTGSRPAKDPAFATSLEHMTLDAEACEFEPDGNGGYLYRDEKPVYPYQVCSNEGMVPHVWEGFFTVWGDFALKGGLGVEKALALYATAKKSPTYDSWRYGDELQKRIEGAEATAALYADDDAGNDPNVWTLSGHVCTGCHQK